VTVALYVPVASPVHRLPAGVKLLCLAALAVLLFARPTLTVAGAALAGTLVVGLGVARLPAAVLARQAWALCTR
jgi:biotin transport system permease protein